MTVILAIAIVLATAVQSGCDWDYGIPGETNAWVPGPRRQLIVGGGNAGVNEYPWQVALASGCGGALIDEEWIMTAAHCLFDQEGEQMSAIEIYLGNGELQRQSLEISVHPDFNMNNLKNDVALIHITPVPCDWPSIKPIKLLDTGFNIDECTAFMHGHGLTEVTDDKQMQTRYYGHYGRSAYGYYRPYGYYGGYYGHSYGRRILEENTENPKSLPMLMEVVSKAFSHDSETCTSLTYEENTEKYYGYYGYPHHYYGRRELDEESNVEIDNTQFCAFTEGEDTCNGDSGSPLLVDADTSITSHEYVIAGITSFGRGCGTSPGVYTKVSAHKDWILTVHPDAKFKAVRECDRNDYAEGTGRPMNEKDLVASLQSRQRLIALLSEETLEISEQLFG